MGILVGIVVVAVMIAAKHIYDIRKEKNEQKETLKASSGVEESGETEFTPIVRLKTLLQLIGAVIEEENEDKESENTELIVSYQGGYYVFSVGDKFKTTRIEYYNFFNCTVEQLKEVQIVTNQINSSYGAWTCYHVYRQSSDDDMQNVHVSMCSYFSLCGNIQELSFMFRTHLQYVFTISRSFENEIKDCIGANVSPINKEFVNDRLFNDKIFYLQNLYRKGLFEENANELPTLEEFSLYNIIMSYKQLDLGMVQSLRIVCDDEVDMLYEKDKIINFDVRDYIISKPNARELTNLIFTFSFEERSVTFVMSKQRGSTKNSIFFQTSLVGVVSDEEFDEVSVPQKPIVLEVRFANAEQDFQEAKFMVAEALEKKENEGTEGLSDNEYLVVATADPALQHDLYWAKKFYNNECYYQSLSYFKRIYKNLSNQSLSEDILDLYYRVCYYISVIYLQMSLYCEAEYFANIAKEGNSIQSRVIWLNALEKLNDPFLKVLIQNELRQISEMMNNEEVSEVHLYYRAFLIRVLVTRFKKLGEYDDAINILRQMIKNNDNIEFAKSELKEIYELKKAQKNQKGNG
jgi:hypothetical protein